MATNNTAEQTLPRDEFTARRRELEGHPEGVSARSTIDVTDFLGNVTTWVLDLHRVEGAVTAFVQRGSSEGYVRLVIPPQVTRAIIAADSTLIRKNRKRIARRVVADKRASGEKLGNPEALALARAKRAYKRKGGQ